MCLVSSCFPLQKGIDTPNLSVALWQLLRDAVGFCVRFLVACISNLHRETRDPSVEFATLWIIMIIFDSRRFEIPQDRSSWLDIRDWKNRAVAWTVIYRPFLPDGGEKCPDCSSPTIFHEILATSRTLEVGTNHYSTRLPNSFHYWFPDHGKTKDQSQTILGIVAKGSSE